MGKVTMMINNAGDVFQLCISTIRKLHNLYRSKQKPVLLNMRVTFHINVISNDS